MPKPKPAHIKNDDSLNTIREYARSTGDSEAGIRGRIATKVWKEKVHYLRKRRRIRLIVTACNQWWTDNEF
jgi:hypothetical protein